MLIARDLGLIYRLDEQETRVLHNVDFRLNPGEAVGVIGPSGSGKSSLLYLLSGLRAPTTGSIAYLDQQYSSMSQQRLTNLRLKHFAFVFQSHFLVSYLTGIENVLAGVNGAAKEYEGKAKELLLRLGVPDVMRKFPHQMSVGQRQRVAIARALIKEAEVIFADEPTASLGQQDALTVMETLSEERGRSAILLVTHDYRLLPYCDRIFELVDGRLEPHTSAPEGLVSSPHLLPVDWLRRHTA